MDAGIKDDFGADSLDIIDLVMEFEKEFELDEINDEQAEKIFTVGDLVKYIEQNKSS